MRNHPVFRPVLVLLCLLGVLALAAPAFAKNFCKDEDSFEFVQKQARAGDAWAQTRLGDCYARIDVYSTLTESDYSQAAEWFRKAAEQGYAEAQYYLGEIYRLGDKNFPSNQSSAVEWYRKAAEQDYHRAQHMMGTMYDWGQGVPQDTNLAIEWHRKAAKNGNTNSARQVERLEGLERDKQQAREERERRERQKREERERAKQQARKFSYGDTVESLRSKGKFGGEYYWTGIVLGYNSDKGLYQVRLKYTTRPGATWITSISNECTEFRSLSVVNSRDVEDMVLEVPEACLVLKEKY